MEKPKQFSRSIWGIAWTSFFWSMSSLMVFSILPAFLEDVLHLSKTTIGFVEGIAVASAFATKFLAGILSDYIGKRKPFIVWGSLLTVLTKPLFAIATGFSWIFAARFIDRMSKGIRSSPTDALIADLTHENKRGHGFGVRQALYTAGAVVGLGAASLLMGTSGDNYRLVFWVATPVAAVALGILFFVVRTKQIRADIPETQRAKSPWHLRDIKQLPSSFWLTLTVVTILMFARFSEMFLTLRVKEIVDEVSLLPLFIMVDMVVHAAIAYPMGKMADKVGSRHKMLLVGVLVLLVANIVMMAAESVSGLLIGVALVGLHLGMTQSLIRTLLSESIPRNLRGTAFSLYYCLSAVALYLGNQIAGILSDIYGVAGAFGSGAVFCVLCIIALLVLLRFRATHSVERHAS